VNRLEDYPQGRFLVGIDLSVASEFGNHAVVAFDRVGRVDPCDGKKTTDEERNNVGPLGTQGRRIKSSQFLRL